MEKTLVLFKPDAINRGIVGEIIERFENKGLKIVGAKMMQLDDAIINEHYSHIANKPFFPPYKDFMKRAPVFALVLEGNNAVMAVCAMSGPTRGLEALPGTIRGDYSMSQGYNIVHRSDSKEAAKEEIARFFQKNEIFDYQRVDCDVVYAQDERE